MINKESDKPVLVIPCSGIGKVQGLISREAAYLATDELAPGKTDTLCLGLIVVEDTEALAAVRSHHCIAVDGCIKACAEKNIAVAGGRSIRAVQVAESLKKYPGDQLSQLGTAARLAPDGWIVAQEVARGVVEEAARMRGGLDAGRKRKDARGKSQVAGRKSRKEGL